MTLHNNAPAVSSQYASWDDTRSRARPVEVVPDSKHAGLYRLRWADGMLSADCYNRTRANDILRRYDGYVDDMRRAAEMRRRKLVPV